MCLSVLCRFCKGNSHGKAHGCYIANLDGFPVSHEGWALYSSVDSSQPSAVWRFASRFRLWLLWSLHSHSRWPYPGMRPACMQLFFLGHLQSHILWYCARWTPTVMFTCWLCVGCFFRILGIWRISSVNCFPMTLEVLVLRNAEIAFQNEGVLPVVAQEPWAIWRLVFYKLPLHQQD